VFALLVVGLALVLVPVTTLALWRGVCPGGRLPCRLTGVPWLPCLRASVSCGWIQLEPGGEIEVDPPAGDKRLGRFACLSSCRSEEHTSELQSRFDLVCRLLLEKKKCADGIQSWREHTFRREQLQRVRAS